MSGKIEELFWGGAGESSEDHRHQALVTLPDETIAKLAATIADELDARRAAREGWVGADVVARHLNVERSYIYEHASELGAVRLGGGERGRLRFQLGRVDKLLSSRATCLTGTASDELTSGVAAPPAEGA